MKSVFLAVLIAVAPCLSHADMDRRDMFSLWILSGFTGVALINTSNYYKNIARNPDHTVVYSKQATKYVRTRVAGVLCLMTCAAFTQSAITYMVGVGDKKTVTVAMIRRF
jgi:hypothetical protein